MLEQGARKLSKTSCVDVPFSKEVIDIIQNGWYFNIINCTCSRFDKNGIPNGSPDIKYIFGLLFETQTKLDG